jgi:hypothetical protein
MMNPPQRETRIYLEKVRKQLGSVAFKLCMELKQSFLFPQEGFTLLHRRIFPAPVQKSVAVTRYDHNDKSHNTGRSP